jgi:hypothetical protein
MTSTVSAPETGQVFATRAVCRAFERNDLLPREFLLQHSDAIKNGTAQFVTVHHLPDGTRVSIVTTADRAVTEIRVISGDQQ